MRSSELLAIINTFVNDIRRNKGLSQISVADSTPLLDDQAGLDSLDLAALVVELQGLSGRDPFEHGFVNFASAGELAALFAA
jgi:acyl carrier protein